MIGKQIFIKVISLFAAVTLVLAGFLIKEKNKTRHYHTAIQNQYTRAYEQLNSSLNNINTAIEKTVYVSSAKKMSSLSAEIFCESELAKSALSEMPLGNIGMSTLYRFLSQIGNYALSVSKSITSENSLNDKQRNELKMLSSTAKTVSEVISDSSIEYNTPDEWSNFMDNQLNKVINKNGLADSLTEAEENLTDYPTLIYDGPYSDHILNKKPLMTSNAKAYTKEEALKKAYEFSNDNTIKFDDIIDGKIKCYRFSGNNVSVAVSCNGGYVTYMRKTREVGNNILTYEQALMKAQRFLENTQMNNLIDTYFYTDNGVCVINFAYLDGQTICYTDLIKVGIAMDTGEIMLLETSGYLTNHTERAFAAPKFSVAQAEEKISSDLDVKKSAITLIPTDAGGEIRCYEFLCTGDKEQEILVYVNMQTLEEEQIYILLKTDGGTLVK